MTVLVELARRAVSHPHTATFVKRAVHGGVPPYTTGNSHHLKPEDVPIWGVVVIYISIFIASVAISLVSAPYLVCVSATCTNKIPTDLLHAQ